MTELTTDIFQNICYIEVAGVPVPEDDLDKWAKSLAIENRVIAKTQRFGFEVSSVFLGTNTNAINPERPICYETMIFGYWLNTVMWRAESRQEVMERHQDALLLIDSAVGDAIKMGTWRRLKAAGIACGKYDPDLQRSMRKWFSRESHKAKATLRADHNADDPLVLKETE